MNWKKTARWSWLILPFLLLTVWPGQAAAQGPNAVLYEVTENLKLKPLTGGHRIATATLAGTVNAGPSICPAWLAGLDGKCDIIATATDDIKVATGLGPVEGKFTVVIQGDNPADGPELAILDGKLTGTIDLSMAAWGLGTLTGEWKAEGVEGSPLAGVTVRGTLTGTFRLPFELAPGVAAYMLNPLAFPNPGSFVLVQGTELSLGLPTVRLEITFVATK